MDAPRPEMLAEAAKQDTLWFLRRVLPSTGLYVSARGVQKGFRHDVYDSIEELARQVLDFDRQGYATYHACAAYRERFVETERAGKPRRQVRTQSNVRAAKAFWMDLDVKPEVDTAFASHEKAFEGLAKFCRAIDLPIPMVISSGGGIHIYWTLTDEIGIDVWRQTAEALKALAHKLEFRADPACTSDPARVLRPVGTTNRKDPANPRPVELVADAPDIAFEEFREKIKAALQQHGVTSPQFRPPHNPARRGLNGEFRVQQNFPDFSARTVADRCQQLARMRDTKGCIPEPLWYHSIQLMCHSIEGDELIHEWSNGYEGYSSEETDRKIAQIRGQNIGPTLCSKFESANPGGCDGCSLKGKITSPAQSGRSEKQQVPAPPHAETQIIVPQSTRSPQQLSAGITIQLGTRPKDGPSTPSAPQTGVAVTNIILPSNDYSISQSALTIFPRLAETGRCFHRGGEFVKLVERPETGLTLCLEQVSAAEFRSLIEKLGFPVLSFIRNKFGGLVLKPKLCSRDSAEALIKSAEARTFLPPIRLVSRSPVLVAHGDTPKVLGPGYHRDLAGILVSGCTEIVPVDLPEAVLALKSLLSDFDFSSPADESRAIAAMITPALRMGGLLLENPNGVAHCPLFVVEADASQAGKGYLQRMTRAIYNERGYSVAPRKGGVGSLDESISQALLSGQPFVMLDNLRERLDSEFLESILTGDGFAFVRVPHRGEVQVDIRAVTFQLTSNGVNMTTDSANRSVIIRIRKRPEGYRFRKWQGGDLVGHVWDRSGYYLSCVFTVISAWLAAGRPRLESGGHHDFREWAGALGWITEKVFVSAPLLEGHRAAQRRGSNPALIWLRQVCLAAERIEQLDQDMPASRVAELCEEEDIDLPGLRGPADEEQARKHVGKLFARCFREATTDPPSIEIEGYRVIRTERAKPDPIHRREVTTKYYRIVRIVRTDQTTSMEKGDFHGS